MARHDKSDPLEKFIDLGSNGDSYLRDDEIADLSEGDIEDVATMLDRQGIDVPREDGLPPESAMRVASQTGRSQN